MKLIINTSTTTTAGMETKANSFPVGLFIGPTIAGLNMIIAGSANTQFKEELANNALYRQMHDGDTIFALVCFKDIGMDEITLRLK